MLGLRLVDADDRLRGRGSRLQRAVIGLRFGQLFVNPGVSRIAIRGLLFQRLRFFRRDRGSSVGNLLIHFLHQSVSRLILGEQFGTLQFQRQQRALQLLLDGAIVGFAH